MSDPDRAVTTDPVPDAATKRRAFFPNLFGKDKEEPAAPALEPPAATAPEPPTGSLTQAPATSSPAAPAPAPEETLPAASPRVTLPAAPPPPASSGRALAELTFSFGVTSLQLTPFFRLGSLELQALSEVVSLSFVAAGNAETPLAAGISFEIDRVELDGARIRSLLLRPLGEVRPPVAPLPDLRVDGVALAGSGDAPITVTTSGGGAAVVQLLGSFAVTGVDFSPGFEVESLRLEPASHAARLRVVPSARPAALDLPPSFDFAEVSLGEGARLDRVRLVPIAAA